MWPIQLEGSVLYTAHQEFKENGLVCTGRGGKSKTNNRQRRVEMHFPRPEVRITPADKNQQPNRKARNAAEAQTQTNTQQLPPVEEGTLEVPSQQYLNQKPAPGIANVQTEISTLETEGANYRQGVYGHKHSVNELAICKKRNKLLYTPKWLFGPSPSANQQTTQVWWMLRTFPFEGGLPYSEPIGLTTKGDLRTQHLQLVYVGFPHDHRIENSRCKHY